jgi:hypothetical protein
MPADEIRRKTRALACLAVALALSVAACGSTTIARPATTPKPPQPKASTTATTPTATASTSTPTRTTPATTTSSPPPCNSTHIASARCATAAAPYCQQGQCSYPVPASGGCAPGYTETTVPSTSSSVCQRPVAGVTTTTPFTPTPAEVAKAEQALPECQRLQPGITLQQLEREAANPEGIQC